VGMGLQTVWEKIGSKAKCQGCPLKKEGEPLIIEPEGLSKIHIMVITEGPNRRTDREFLTSIANHPTFTFLFSLFGGNFKPEKDSANTYWTHVRKCFINGNVESGRRALKPCSNSYLEDEIEALKPKLIVAVGKSSLDFLSKYDSRLEGKLNEIFKQQTEDIFNGVKIGSVNLDIAVVPHPSGLNRFWNKPPPETLEILLSIRKRMLEIPHMDL